MSAIANVIQPRFLHIGPGVSSKCLQQCLDLAGATRPLIVTDTFIANKTPFLSTVLGGRKFATFDECIPDPTTDSVGQLVNAIQSGNHDALVAIGGGSPIDTAKAASVLCKLGGEPLRNFKAPFEMNRHALPVIAVPTTAGTGSEVSRFTVVSDSETKEKMLCAGSSYVPFAALVDYELTMNMPWRLTADTALDSLTHAIESFVSTKRNAFTMPLSLAAMTAISQFVVTACEEPNNRVARASLMLAATQAGLAFSNSSVGLVHAMSRPLGAHFHIPHGLSNAILLPRIIEFSAPGARELYTECAFATGTITQEVEDLDSACDQLVLGLRLLSSKLRVPTLKELGISEDKYMSLIPLMTDECIASGSHLNNPRVPTADEIEDLYHDLWNEIPLQADTEMA
jgi:alcohol dehydrogenase class IV